MLNVECGIALRDVKLSRAIAVSSQEMASRWAAGALFVATLAIVGCGARSGVVIYAPSQLSGGRATLDRTERTELTLLVHYKWVGWRNMREELSLPPRSESIARFDALARGFHEIVLERDRYQPIVIRFLYRGNAVELIVPDALLQPR
jgi:hypothetical protein